MSMSIWYVVMDSALHTRREPRKIRPDDPSFEGMYSFAGRDLTYPPEFNSFCLFRGCTPGNSGL